MKAILKMVNQPKNTQTANKMIVMQSLKLTFLFFILTHTLFAQLDSDFKNAKRSAEFYLSIGDYENAKKQYQIALVIKENDVYCKAKIDTINKIEIQRKRNKAEKLNTKQPKKNAKQSKPYYGNLKAQFDENNDKFDYVGYIQNGQPDGHGIADYRPYNNNSFKEEGEWQDGKRYGIFKASNDNGDTIEAQYKNGQLNGKITYNIVEDNSKFELSFKNGKLYGLQNFFNDLGRLEVLSLDGKLKGNGTFYTKEGGVKISGYYEYDGFVGEVSFTSTEFSGTGFYKDGGISGMAKYNYVNGNRFEGYVVDSHPNGKGKMSYYDGMIYDGNWLNGLWDGYGTLTVSQNITIMNCPKCITYVGWFLNDLKHGNGKCLGINGELIYNGKFENNKPIDKYPSRIKKRNP
jgi:hypothetical protein